MGLSVAMQVFRGLSPHWVAQSWTRVAGLAPRGPECSQAGLDGLEILTEEIRLSWVQGMAPLIPGDTKW